MTAALSLWRLLFSYVSVGIDHSLFLARPVITKLSMGKMRYVVRLKNELHMQSIKGISRYLGPDLGRKVPQPSELLIPHDGSLCETFRKALLQQNEAFSTAITFPSYPTLACNFAYLGQTAGIAHWFRNEVTLF